MTTSQSSLPPKFYRLSPGREVRLRVAQINNCSYCLILHAETRRTIGIHPAQIDNLGSWWESELFDAAEQAALA